MSNLPLPTRSFPHRVRCGSGPRVWLDVWAVDEADGKARATRIRSFIAALVKAGRVQAALELARDAAAAKRMRDFADIERAAHTAAARPVSEAPAPDAALTYREVVRRHLAGELHQKRPRDVESIKDKGAKALWGVYDGHILNVSIGPRGLFGDQPIALLTKADAMVVRDEIGPDYSDGMYRLICSAIRRPFLNAEMFGWIDRSPIPLGFVPPAGKSRVGTYMHPDEDEAYLGCREHPLVDRVAYGFGARNGCRPGEVAAAQVRDVDFKRGTFKLPKNKTNSPREWRLEPDSLRALRLIVPEGASPSDRVFAGFELSNSAARLRKQLASTPGCDRARLYEDSALERPICMHHAMRGTFVTLALANSGTPEGQHRTEQWVRDRTGHCTSKEIEGYRKDARMAVEHEQRWLAPLDQAIPELRKLGALHTSKAAAARLQVAAPTAGVVAAAVSCNTERPLHDGPPVARGPRSGVGRGVGQKRDRQPETAQGVSPWWSNPRPDVESSTSIRAQKRGGRRPHAPPSTPPGPPLEGGVGQAEALAAYLAALTAAGDLDTAAAVLEAARRHRAPPPDNVTRLDEVRRRK